MQKNMRRILSFLLIAALLLSALPMAVTAAEQAEKKVFKVLAIGNSFSDDGTQHLYQIAEDAGAEEIVLGNLYIGSCSLETHWNNAKNNSPAYEYRKNTSGGWNTRARTTMEYGILDEDWDFITIQQVSQDSGMPNTYQPYLDSLIDYVQNKKTNPNAKLGWHMTWAYQQNSTHGGFANYGNNQTAMYNAIVSTVQQYKDKFDFVIPSGTAIQNVRTSYIGDTLTRDGYHLSYNLGRYIAGLTWVKAITGWSIDDIAYVPSISDIPPEYLPIVKEAVNNAVATPYAVTPSSYASKPEITDNYTLLDIKFGDTVGYWNSGSGGYSANPQPTLNASNSVNFIYTAKRFTKADIPAGSIIEIDAGYQYRPDGWGYSGAAAPGRPGNVTDARFTVTDAWWSKYEYRAFNIAEVGNATDLRGKEAEVASKFRIYIPKVQKSSDKAITAFSVGEEKGIFTGNQITLTFLEGTDVTALEPAITVSDKATVSPTGVQDFTKPVRYTVTAEDGSTQTYVARVEFEEVRDFGNYDKLEIEFGSQPGYWNTGNGGYQADPKPSFDRSDFLYTAERFTEADIPVGSVIVIARGYQYRPEGWGYSGATAPGRPGEMTDKYFTVTEEWWENYEYRGFNIAVKGLGVSMADKIAVADTIFQIYVPKAEDLAARVESLIDALPDAGDVSVYEHETNIQKAQSAYDNLSQAHKALIPGEKKAKLDKCIQALEAYKATYVKYEAEAALLENGAKINTPADPKDLSGGACVENLGANAGTLTFTVHAENAGKRYIDIYYATYVDRYMDISINGGEYIRIQGYGNGTDWYTGVLKASMEADLVKGENTIAITNTSDYAPQIDYIAVPDVTPNQKEEQPIFTPGDVDESGTVDVADIMKLKALIMMDKWSDEELTVGDLDNSKKLDVGDIMAVKNIIMSK